MNDILIREAIRYGAKLAIKTDAHDPAQLVLMRYGVAVWAETSDVINTFPRSRFLKSLGKKGNINK